MYSLITLILLTIFFYIWLKKILDKNRIQAKDNYAGIKNEYAILLRKNARLKQNNLNLDQLAQQTIALYDITKDICKSLDIDTVFSNFRDEINKHIEVGDCKLLKNDNQLLQYKDYTVLPLKIDRNPVGYLLVNGIKEQDKDKFHILTQQFILGIKRALLYQQVQELAITDSLTGAFSRRYYLERFDEELMRAKKFNCNLSFLMADVDRFKDYNDHYGHLAGDAVLREASNTIKDNIRQIDLLGRYGGEEFAVILTETDKEQARFAAERIRQAIEQKKIRAYDEDLKITISIGIATFPEDAQDITTLIDRADWALYRAKQTGRNRVCAYKVYQ